VYVGVRVLQRFYGDDTEVEREFAGTQSLAESVASASSGVFPRSLVPCSRT